MRATSILLALAAIGLPPGVSIARTEDGLNVSFGAAISYVYDLAEPKNPANNSQHYANFEDRPESFNVDLVQLQLEGRRDRASYGAKVDFGDLAALVGDSLEGDVALQEAFLAYDFGPVIGRAGRFETPIGYEALEPWSNNQISRSRAWLLQPISQDGATLAFAVGPVGMMAGILNSFFITDPIANDIDSEKGLLLSLTTSLTNLDASTTLLYSEDDLIAFDNEQLLLNPIVSTKWKALSLALEGNWLEENPGTAGRTTDTWNVTGYASTVYHRSQWSLRTDYGSYERPPSARSFRIWSVTGTFGWILSSRMDVRLEYRHDENIDRPAGSRPFFAERHEPFGKSSADVIQVQLVWYPEGW